MAKPDLVVYVRATIEVLAERLRKRNRDFERHISFEYLERVSAAYRDFFFYYDEAPLLVVDTSDIDFVANPEDLTELIREIDNAGPGIQYFVPARAEGIRRARESSAMNRSARSLRSEDATHRL